MKHPSMQGDFGASAKATSIPRRLRLRHALGCALALTLMSSVSDAVAHTEPMHGVATMLAHQYLTSAAASTAHPQKARAARALPRVNQVMAASLAMPANAALARERKFVLGIDNVRMLDLPFSVDQAPQREHPGLSGYGVGPIEFPRGGAAFLGFLVANVDTYADTWISARHPFQVVESRVESGLAPIRQVLDAAYLDGPFDYADSCSGGGFFESIACGLALLLLSPVYAADAILGAVLGRAGVGEAIAEDFVSGCDSNIGQDAVVDRLKEAAPGTISRAEEAALRDDSAFFRRHGAGFDLCDRNEERLEDATRFVVPGRPVTEANLMLTTRARYLDFLLAPGRNIKAHFKSYEPWFLSSEAAKRTQRANPVGLPDWQRWRMESFTMVNHFLDILSPVDGAAVVASSAGPGVAQMAGPRRGRVHTFDGYSLLDGKRFYPNASALRPERPADDVFSVFAIKNWDLDDNTIRAKAAQFDAVAERATGYVTLRRRVCAAGVMPSLRTTDGLGESDCNAAKPETRKNIVERVENPPADLGALDGYDQWLHAGPPAVLQSDGEAYTHFATYMPPVRAIGPAGAAPQMSPHHCGTAACREDAQGNAHDAQYRQFAGRAPRDHGDAMRLRGLALAMHMAQDMTVPHHLAPTTGHGHASYEAFMADYTFPFVGAGANVVEFYTQSSTFTTTGVGRGTHRFLSPTPLRAGDPLSARFARSGTDATAVYNAVVAEMSRTGFWAEVDAEFAELSRHMAALATAGCPADKFSVRRLLRATAYRTAEQLRVAGSAFDASGITHVAMNTAESGFWLASALADDPDLSMEMKRVQANALAARDAALAAQGQVARRAFAQPTWVPFAHASLPTLIAASAHMFLGAGEGLLDPRSTCDGGGNADPTPPPAGNEPRVPPSGQTCEERALDAANACVRAGQNPCAPYSSAPEFVSCAQSRGTGQGCARVVTITASCSCVPGQTGSGLLSCTRTGLRDAALRDLMAVGAIDEATLRYQRGGGAGDADGDGIPDGVDGCNERPATAAVLAHTTINASVCLRNQPGCAYGCIPK